jgi:chemotaxis protein histidine kinase CheA
MWRGGAAPAHAAAVRALRALPAHGADLARELGKEVELVVDGEDTRADRAVVESLRDPLLHLVRNALDHGLETRVDRVARASTLADG